MWPSPTLVGGFSQVNHYVISRFAAANPCPCGGEKSASVRPPLMAGSSPPSPLPEEPIMLGRRTLITTLESPTGKLHSIILLKDACFQTGVRHA
jgi:hypothetical protein